MDTVMTNKLARKVAIITGGSCSRENDRKVRKAMSKLQDRLDEFKKTFSSGIEEAALKVGDRAPR